MVPWPRVERETDWYRLMTGNDAAYIVFTISVYSIFLFSENIYLFVTYCITGRPVNYQDIWLCNQTPVIHLCGTYTDISLFPGIYLGDISRYIPGNRSI